MQRELIPAMKEVLEVIRKKIKWFGDGHVSINVEVFAIAGEALRQHVGVIITHPMPDPLVLFITIEEPKSWRRWERIRILNGVLYATYASRCSCLREKMGRDIKI